MSASGREYEMLEMFVAPKTPGGTSEGMVASLCHLTVVLDGVTGKDSVTYRGMTGGLFATETVMSCLEGLPADVDARTAVDSVTAALRKAIVAELGVFPPHPPGTQMAVYSPRRGEIWLVGDVHVRIGAGLPYPTLAPPTDGIATAFRAALLEACLLEGSTQAELATVGPSWDAMLPLLSRQGVLANLPDPHPLGYGIINGTRVPERHLTILRVSPGTEVVLATDGYLSASGTLAEAETALAELLQADPLLIRRYQGFRAAPAGGSFDARGWIRFIAGPQLAARQTC